jgi:hypothetical protein
MKCIGLVLPTFLGVYAVSVFAKVPPDWALVHVVHAHHVHGDVAEGTVVGSAGDGARFATVEKSLIVRYI